MLRRSTILFCTLALAACSSENAPVPTALTPGDALLNTSGGIDGLDDGIYLVRFRGAIPSDFGARVAKLGGEVVFTHAGARVGAVRDLTPETAAKLSASAGVDVAQDDAVEISVERGDVESATGEGAVANDGINSPTNPAAAFFYARQWGMRAIAAPAAWADGKLGSATTKVGILDTGLDYLHPDLWGRVDLDLSRSFLSAAENARVQAAFPGAHPVADIHYHGTHVGATVVSNGLAAAGVTSRVTLVGLKVCFPNAAFNGICPTSGTMAAILFAADNGIPVINMSLGGSFLRRLASAKGGSTENANPSFIAVINDVFQYANRNGTVVVVSAGNAAADMQHAGNTYYSYCDAPHAICVSATGPTAALVHGGTYENPDARAPYSNFGNRIDVAAPGGAGRNASATNPVLNRGWVYAACSGFSIVPGLGGPLACGGRFYNPVTGAWSASVIGVNGTSMAAPHATGVAALIAGTPGIDASGIRTALHGTSDDLGDGGKDPVYGFGRVNAYRASR